MASCYPNVVEEWQTRQGAFPPQTALLLLDRFIVGTMERVEGEDRTDPDRWGEAMRDVLETELGEPMPPDLGEPTREDPTHLESIRKTLRRLVTHYFTTDWETTAGPNGPP